LAKELSTKYTDQARKVPLEYDSKEKMAQIIAQSGDEYFKRARGTQNFGELRELLKHLYRNLITLIHNNSK